MNKAWSTFLVTLVAVSACTSSPGSPDTSDPTLDIVAGTGITDTISSRPAQGLVVRVTDEDGKPAAGVEVRFAAGGVLGMAVAPLGGESFSGSATAITDANGRATVRYELGIRPGVGWVAVNVPLFNLTDTARYAVQPGRPASLGLSPADTTIMFGSSFTYRTAIVDRAGNPLTGAGTFSTNGNIVQVNQTGLVTSTGLGSAIVMLAALVNGTTTSATANVTVRMPGTIAWTVHPENLAFGSVYDIRRNVPGAGGAASWEPGKGRVVASRNGALMLVDTLGNIQPLSTPGFTGVTWPEWSTDGWIYFHGTQGGNTAVGRVRPDGTSIQTIAGTAGAQMPTVSPDANSVAYALPAGIVIQTLATGATRTLANTAGALTPRWSNDGQWITFTRGQFGDLMVVRPDGTQLQKVASSIHAGLTWSPDSRWILARGANAATLVDMNTLGVVELTGVNFGEYPGWKR